MRRQTTKQPSGAATTASPSPASRARIRNGSPTSAPLAVGAVRSGRRVRLARQVVPVVVMVVVEAEGARRLRPEEARILRMLSHRLGNARAAHMAVETDDAVALRHDHVQVVRDEQNAEAALGA